MMLFPVLLAAIGVCCFVAVIIDGAGWLLSKII